MAALSKAGRYHGNDLRGVVDAVIDAWAPLGCGSEAAALYGAAVLSERG
jgi:hypothetical protein